MYTLSHCKTFKLSKVGKLTGSGQDIFSIVEGLEV
jgi:hypothetical protein